MEVTQNALECRNCGSHNTLILNQGTIAPFFLKRVHSIQLMSLGEQINQKLDKLPDTLIKKTLNSVFQVLSNTTIGKQLNKFRSAAKTNISVCTDCGFVCPNYNYDDSQLFGLYEDYRSDSYDSEREFFEPQYKNIQSLVGKSGIEINNRLNNMSNLISKYVELQSIETVLDWGGEGKFIPKELRNKKVFILDVSNELLADNTFIRIKQPAADEKFDFIQICHVLEHLPSPRDFLRNVLSYLKIGGYLYLEVPQDRTEEDIQRFVKANPNVSHKIHEHLNLYSTQSIKALANSLDLKELVVEKNKIDIEWMELNIISGLFMKI